MNDCDKGRIMGRFVRKMRKICCEIYVFVWRKRVILIQIVQIQWSKQQRKICENFKTKQTRRHTELRLQRNPRKLWDNETFVNKVSVLKTFYEVSYCMKRSDVVKFDVKSLNNSRKIHNGWKKKEITKPSRLQRRWTRNTCEYSLLDLRSPTL